MGAEWSQQPELSQVSCILAKNHRFLACHVGAFRVTFARQKQAGGAAPGVVGEKTFKTVWLSGIVDATCVYSRGMSGRRGSGPLTAVNPVVGSICWVGSRKKQRDIRLSARQTICSLQILSCRL